MTPREELDLRRQLQQASPRQELVIRRQLAGVQPEVAQEPAAEPGPSFSAGEMVSNIPSSALKLGEDMLNAVLNPKQTLTAVGGLVESGLERLNPFAGPEDYEYQQYPEAVAGAMKERYGGVGPALNTLETDPMGLLADLSGAVTGVGTAARVPMIAKAGAAIDPINMALNIPKAGLTAAIPSKLPAYLYEKSAKFPPAQVPREVREPAIETALSNKILPTYGGIDKITEKLGGLDVKINDLITAADASGKTIARQALYSDLSDLRRQLSAGADAPANLRKYTKVVKDIDEMLKQGPDRLTPSAVQKFKTQTYKDIKWRGKANARTETLKALARGAKKSIEQVAPEIADVNRAYGPLAELRKVLEQPAQRIYNRNPISLPTAGTTTAGAAVGGPLGAATGAAVGTLQNPAIMARLALGLRGAQDRGVLGALTSGSPEAQMLRQGLLQSGRLEELMR